MKTYEVTLFVLGLPYNENRTRVVTIEAESQDEAEQKAHDWYVADGWGVYDSKELPMKSKKIFSINVAGGKHGYSFAIKCDATEEADAVQMAENAGLFEDDEDAFFATAEDITDSEYDINGLKDCTYEV